MPSFLQRSTTSSLKAQNPVPGTLKAPLLTPAAFIESLDVDEGRLSQENLAAADAANKSASVSPVEATMSEGHSESFEVGRGENLHELVRSSDCGKKISGDCSRKGHEVQLTSHWLLRAPFAAAIWC